MPNPDSTESIVANEITADAVPTISVLAILETIIQKAKPEIIIEIDSIYRYNAPSPTVPCLSTFINPDVLI